MSKACPIVVALFFGASLASFALAGELESGSDNPPREQHSKRPSCSHDNSDDLVRNFLNPPDWAKPSGYWWWLNGNVDKEAITRDLEQFKAKGMGAVLLVSSGQWGGRMTAKGPPFLSNEWRDLYKHALNEAHRVGIKVDVNIAPGWNMGGPWVTPEKSCRWFLQSETTLKGPQKFSGKLPLPGARDGYDSPPQLGVRTYIDLPLDEVDYRDTAVVAFRTPAGGRPDPREDLPAKSNRLDANCFIPAQQVMSQTLGPWRSSATDHPIQTDAVIDLTSKLKPDGTLNWEVPDGEWTVVRTGHRMTGAMLSVPMPGQGGLENDYLDRAGVELMFEKVGKILIADAGPLAGNTLRGFCSDSFECGYPNWTANLVQRFRQYRGYDPLPYMPVFRGWIVGSAEISDRFLYDYRKTVADCFADEHYGRFAELCHEQGLLTRCESAGPSWSGTMCMNGLKNLGRVDFPQGEFWRYTHFIQDGQNMVGKQTASAAHIYGKRTASAEALTAAGRYYGHWNASPKDLKPTVDIAFCEGINNCVFHTVTCQRPVDGKPGYEYGAGTHFNPNVTWWDQAAGPWLDYINRCQTLLQSGRFVADVLYYNGDWAPNLVGPKRVDEGLGPGYDYDVCNAEVLLTRLSVKDGRLVLPDGMSYRLLVLPTSQRMPVEVIRKLDELVRAGATIVGPKPVSAPGLKNYPENDATVREIVKDLWGEIDGQSVLEIAAGRGRVFQGRSPREILNADGVPPDVEVAGAPDTFLDFIHRATPKAEIYFLANRNARPEKLDVTFRQTGRQPELWNPVSGDRRDLPEFTIKEDRTTVPLEFEPHGSMFVVFRRPATTNEGRNFARFDAIQEVKGPWTVSFEKEWFYPVDELDGSRKQGNFVFEELSNWSKHPVPAVKHFSGTAHYESEFSFRPGAEPNDRYWLNLGEVHVTAAVRVNGADLGVVWCAPWQVDVTDALRDGVNRLEVEVVNRWPNRLIGDGKLPEHQRRTRTNISRYYTPPRTGEHPLLPSGLIGPVRILATNQ